jgi:hypothetical protein
MKFGYIPSHIVLEDLVLEVIGNKTKKQSIIDGIVYFLSKISLVDNQRRYEGLKFINLHFNNLESIIGKGSDNKRVKTIKDILINKGIVECDSIYYRKTKSLGYRLTLQNNTGEFRKIDFSESISNNIIEYFRKKIENGELGDIDFEDEEIEIPNFINEQFSNHQVSINPLVKDHLRVISEEIILGLSRRSKFQILKYISFLNYVGYLLQLIEEIERGEFRPTISKSNNRLNSLFTSLPKILRPYLLINGNPIGEVDIVSSQPYILSTILNNSFQSNNLVGQYNLGTIYPNLETEMNNIGRNVPSNNGERPHNILGCYLDDNEFNSINQFCNFDFREDFYSHLVTAGLEIGIITTRDKVKKDIMNLLFNRKEVVRKHINTIILVDGVYFGLTRFIERLIYIFGGRDFALLLQRTESYLILNKFCEKLYETNPQIPFYTIHDSILTDSQSLQIVSELMSETIFEITNKPVGLKTKDYSVLPNIEDLRIKIISKTKIKNQEDFEKKRFGIYTKNIKTSIEFLFPNSEWNVWYQKLGI